MRPRLRLQHDLEVDGGSTAGEEQELTSVEKELTSYASSMFVRARPDLVARINERVERQPRGPAPRRFFSALVSLDPRAVVQAFRMTLVVAFGNIGVPDVMRAQALLVVLLVTSVAYTGALGTAGIVVGIADATRPQVGGVIQPGGPSDEQIIIDGTVFSSESSGRLETLATPQPVRQSTRQAGTPERARSNVSRAPQRASRPSNPKRWGSVGGVGSTKSAQRSKAKGPKNDGPKNTGPKNSGPKKGGGTSPGGSIGRGGDRDDDDDDDDDRGGRVGGRDDDDDDDD